MQATVTVSGVVNGRVTSDPAGIDCPSTCSAGFADGTNVSLTATPAAGFEPANWAGSGVTCAPGSNCVVQAGASVTVGFAETPVLRIVAPSTSPSVGQSVALQIASDAGPVPVDAAWTLGDTGTASGLSTTHSWMSAATFTVTANVTLTGGRVVPTSATIVVVPMPAPAQVSPASGALFGNFPRTTTLTWQSVPGATQYRVEVECKDCQQAGQFSSWKLENTSSISYSFTWVGDNVGRWRVTGIASDGVTMGTPSDWWTFDYDTRVPTPAQVGPADGAVFNNFPRTTTFTWQSTSNAVLYHVEVEYCQTSGQCNPDMQQTSSATSFTMDFVGKQPGRWRVTAIDVNGVQSVPSPWWNFTYTI